MSKIKLSTLEGDESLWAWQLSDDTAIIRNIPFMTDTFSLGDRVRFDAQGRILEVLEHGAHTKWGAYEATADEGINRNRWVGIVEHLSKYDIKCEWGFPGYFAMSVPGDISDDLLRQLCAQVDVKAIIDEADMREVISDDGSE